MLSCHYDDSFPVISFFVEGIGDNKSFNHSLGDCLPNLYLLNDLFVAVMPILSKFAEFEVAVRKRMSNPKFIFLESSGYFEGKFIIHSRGVLALKFAFFINYFLASSLPSLLKQLNQQMLLFTVL